MKALLKRVLFFIFIFFLILKNLLWLSIFLLLLFLFYKGVDFLIKKIIYFKLKNIIQFVFKIAMIFLLGISVRVFIFDIYMISSSSMSNTLYKGDVILLNKLKYGPILPKSFNEIPLINLFLTKKQIDKQSSLKEYFKTKRLSGIDNIQRNDVVVFKKYNSTNFFVKRCIAIAGDKLKIENGEIKINGEFKNPPENVKNTYEFKITSPEDFENKIKLFQLDLNIRKDKKDKSLNIAEISYKDYEIFKKFDCIDSLKRRIKKYRKKSGVFPKGKIKHKWTVDNYGIIKLPREGFVVNLNDKEAYNLYKEPIIFYENEGAVFKKDKFFSRDSIVNKYTFIQDYYFMLGDNRKNSKDSRYFGFIPKEKIIGKAVCVLFSLKNNSIDWSRFLQPI
jgi:signal peptidase I